MCLKEVGVSIKNETSHRQCRCGRFFRSFRFSLVDREKNGYYRRFIGDELRCVFDLERVLNPNAVAGICTRPAVTDSGDDAPRTVRQVDASRNRAAERSVSRQIDDIQLQSAAAGDRARRDRGGY